MAARKTRWQLAVEKRAEVVEKYAHLDGVELKYILRSELDRVFKRPAIPGRTRKAVYDRDGNACVECGATERLSLDHIYPWSLGGEDTIENLQTLCRPCNSRKGARA